MFQPALARAIEQASPKPDEAPRTRAHRVRVSPAKAARMLARANPPARPRASPEPHCKLISWRVLDELSPLHRRLSRSPFGRTARRPGIVPTGPRRHESE